MALRPTDIQMILQISRDVERVQLLQQQYGRRQQEHLTAYMERQLEEKKKQTLPVNDAGQVEIRAINEDEQQAKQNPSRKRQRPQDVKAKKRVGQNIDLFI